MSLSAAFSCIIISKWAKLRLSRLTQQDNWDMPSRKHSASIVLLSNRVRLRINAVMAILDLMALALWVNLYIDVSHHDVDLWWIIQITFTMICFTVSFSLRTCTWATCIANAFSTPALCSYRTG